jgi:hypothetical protein
MGEQAPVQDVGDVFSTITEHIGTLLPFGVGEMTDIEYDSSQAMASGAGVTHTYTKTLIDDEGGEGD